MYSFLHGEEVKEVYDLQDWAAVHRVYKQTGSKRETARILGMVVILVSLGQGSYNIRTTVSH